MAVLVWDSWNMTPRSGLSVTRLTKLVLAPGLGFLEFHFRTAYREVFRG